MPLLTKNQTSHDRDLSRTTVLRKQYSADCYKRFRAVKGLIRSTIDKFDALDLRQNVEAVQSFAFTSDADKQQAFMDWLRQAQDDEILEVTNYSGGRIAGRKEWQNLYVRRGYQKGIQYADKEVKKAGINPNSETFRQVFNKPIHANALATLYTRNFRELKGITEVMDQQISRELADGFAQGWNPRKVAKNINDRVDKIGITRARTLARTETIRAHSEATHNRYNEYGVKYGRFIFGRGPCPTGICPDEASKGVQKLSEINWPPMHPNCTCTVAPEVKQ